MLNKICFFILFLSLGINAQAQNYAIEGIVLDSLEQPLEGATIVLLNPSSKAMIGFAMANSNGAFRVECDSIGTYELQLTYIGYGSFSRIITMTVIEHCLIKPECFLYFVASKQRI